MKTITLKEHHARKILTEQLSDQEVSDLLSYLDRIDNLMANVDIPEIDSKIDDAREFLSQVEAGKRKTGVFGRDRREAKKKMQVVQNATVQVANLLQNMKKIVTLSAKNLIPRLKQSGFDRQDNVADVLGRLGGNVNQRMEMLIKANLQPKWLKGKPAVDAGVAANQMMSLPFEKFMRFVQKSSAGDWKVPQSDGSERDAEEESVHDKLLKTLGIKPGDQGQEHLTKVIQMIKKNQNMSKGFVNVLDTLKGVLGSDFDPNDLQAVYNALKT
jgi:hypothetical protein